MCVPVAPPPGVHLRPVKPVTEDDVQKVHIMLECCIKRAMTKQQAVAQLQLVGVQPLVAALVWDRLEEENPTFFAAYHKQQAQQGLEQLCHAI